MDNLQGKNQTNMENFGVPLFQYVCMYVCM